ncbi:MAG TPA: SDR family oxidoreductase [Caldithrix abyssi]|uniref:SDR family oxidoreductase n=1 Tax=Caldithrix abyssi TaxID=187145 RepID=A0A7V4WUC8_CALAY|nr:SDR family oxidoreductase [Caldithrix abyssi]
MDIQDKVILVTGGAVRIGRAITLELLKAGGQVFCHYYSSRKAAQNLSNVAADYPGTLHLYSYDLMKPDAAQKIISQTIKTFGRIDVLINNAAIFFKTPLGSVREEDWDVLHTLNLKQVFFLSQEAGLRMKQQGFGKIINIADAGAESPFPSYIPYSVTKAGVVALTRGLAKALAPEVLVNCISPGPVMLPEDYVTQEKEQALRQTLLKREGSAEDIARTVRFLIEGSDYITGAVIPVDGGRQIR